MNFNIKNIENVISNATTPKMVIIYTNKGLMTIKDFIMKSNCFQEDGNIILDLNKKVRLVSCGEGGNRHFSIEKKDKWGWHEIATLWYDIHEVEWCSVRIDSWMCPKGLEKTIVWCVAKNGNAIRNCGAWDVGSLDGMSEVILDLMTYIR